MMAKAVWETASSANACVEGQWQPEATEQCAEEFSSRVTRWKAMEKDPCQRTTLRQRHTASVLNTFSTVLETCCCQPRWMQGSSTGVLWMWSGVAPATTASHDGNSTPRSTNLSAHWFATAKQPSPSEWNPAKMVAARAGSFLCMVDTASANSPNKHHLGISLRLPTPILRIGMGAWIVGEHPC